MAASKTTAMNNNDPTDENDLCPKYFTLIGDITFY